MKLFLSFIFFWFCTPFFFGQNSNVINYTVNDGLASSQVYDVRQDNKGNLWFATDRGLSVFNGYTFKTKSITHQSSSNVPLLFFQEKNGRIWFYTLENKIFYIDENTQIIPYPYNDVLVTATNQYLIHDLVFYEKCLYVACVKRSGYLKIDLKGRLYNHLCRFDDIPVVVNERVGGQDFSYHVGKGLSDTSFVFQQSKKNRTSGKYNVSGVPRTVTIDRTVILNNGNSVEIQSDSNTITQNFDKAILNLGKFDDTHFWIGSFSSGLKIFNLEGQLEKELLKGKMVSNLFKDQEGGVWVTTLNSGVFYFDEIFVKTRNYKNNSIEYVNSITSDENGNVFVGYYNGDIVKWKNKEHQILGNSIFNLAAIVQYVNSDKTTWLYAGESIWSYSNNTLKKCINTTLLSTSIVSDQKKHKLLTGYKNWIFDGTRRYTVNQRLMDVCRVDSLRIFCATNTGLFLLKDTSFRKWSDNPRLNTRINDIDVFQGNYYAATMGMGIVVFNEDTLFNIDREHGLYSNLINEITVENDSVLWVGTSKGLNKVVFKPNGEFDITGISFSDGLPNNQVTAIEIIRDIVWVGTRGGLCLFNKKKYDELQNQAINYHLRFNRILVNDKPVLQSRLKSLGFSENRIELNYQAVSFNYNKDLIYRYKLKGLEEKWQYTTNLTIVYQTLVPGAYQFILQVNDGKGKWKENEIRTYITINPSFYSTWWFKSTLFFLLAGFTYLFFKFRILSYNREIFREMLRYILKRLKNEVNFLIIKEQGNEIKVNTEEIYYIKAAGNYLELFVEGEKIIIRKKMNEFFELVPDPIEFLRVHRSYIVRIDKINKWDKKNIIIKGTKIPISDSYKDSLKSILG